MIKLVSDDDPYKGVIDEVTGVINSVINPLVALSSINNVKICKICKNLNEMYPRIIETESTMRGFALRVRARSGNRSPQPSGRRFTLVFGTDLDNNANNLNDCNAYIVGRYNIYDRKNHRFVSPIWFDDYKMIKLANGTFYCVVTVSTNNDSISDENKDRLKDVFGENEPFDLHNIVLGNGTLLLSSWAHFAHFNSSMISIRLKNKDGIRLNNILSLSDTSILSLPHWQEHEETHLYNGPSSIEQTLRSNENN